MSTLTTDTFNVPELFLLADAFEGNILFGLPDKRIYQLEGEAVFEDAYNLLKEKGILNEEGHITDGGMIVIQALEFYYQSKKYVRINNMMFAFREKEADEVILLIEIEEQRKYKLMVVSKAIVLRLFGDHFPIVFREPKEHEKTFLKEKLPHYEKHEIEQFETDIVFNLERFHVGESKQEVTNSAFYQQWLVFEKDEKLIMVDTVNQIYYHASQYWFLKVLFDELEFPYKEVV